MQDEITGQKGTNAQSEEKFETYEDCENGFGKQVEQTSTRLLHIKIRALESALEKLRQITNEYK